MLAIPLATTNLDVALKKIDPCANASRAALSPYHRVP
jgi:hypothetical protein